MRDGWFQSATSDKKRAPALLTVRGGENGSKNPLTKLVGNNDRNSHAEQQSIKQHNSFSQGNVKSSLNIGFVATKKY